jgi:two-component system, LytTR family, response regulator
MDMRIAIVDDEPACRGVLRNILRRDFADVQVIGEAGSVAEGMDMLQLETPDLLLLDVEMEDGTGFDLLDQLGQVNFNVVFTTAHNDFAIRAFRYHAIDYLLKPVVPEELAIAVEKARQHVDRAQLQWQIADLLKTHSGGEFDRIALPTGDGLVFAFAKDMMHLESYGNFSFVFLASGERFLVSRNLKEFEEILPASQFFRTHQSHIVNINFVKQAQKGEGDYALLHDGAKVPVARRKKDAFWAALVKR